MWYQQLKKSIITPPSIIFQIMWPILYILMCISLLMYLKSYNDNILISLGFWFFVCQLVLNILWTPIFFYYHKLCISVNIIIYMILFTILTMIEFYKVNMLSSILLIPYIIWIIFALYLNLYICLSNK